MGPGGYRLRLRQQADCRKDCYTSASMPDQELLDDFLEALEEVGSPAKNPALREALGWDEGRYEEVKAELVAKGIVKRGMGRSDSVSLVGAEPAVKARHRPVAAARTRPEVTAPPKTNPSNPGSGTPPARSAAPRTRRNTRTTSCR